MSDLKFYAELALTLDVGFQTVKGKQIDDLYRRYNGTFPHEIEYGELIRLGIDAYFDIEALQVDDLRRSHLFQSVVLSIIALKRGGKFSEHADEKYGEMLTRIRGESVPLDVLLASIQDPEAYSALYDFIQACTQKTNVEQSRVVRFFYFREALRPFI
jgi:hypothetical protein